MLKKNFLASNVVYCSIAHNDKLLSTYFDILNDIFYKISNFKDDPSNIIDILEGKICMSGFREIDKN